MPPVPKTSNCAFKACASISLWCAALLATAMTGAFAADNLLANGGFETANGPAPASWDVYTMPHVEPGSSQPDGRCDGAVAFEGTHSAVLSNPVPYAKDPFNNFSQRVPGELAGKRLQLKASIKTQDATAAVVWVQCWSKAPLSVIHLAETRPIAGTNSWTPVETTFTAPSNTAFAIVRCVLKGTGTAWFDDVQVLDLTAAAPTPPPAAPSTGTTTTAPAPAPSRDTVAEEMVKASERMADTVHSLREANDALIKQVGRLQSEISTLREELHSLKPDSEPAPAQVSAPEPPAPQKSSPILVPHASSAREAK